VAANNLNRELEATRLPKFTTADGISNFVADLRSIVFASQAKAAKYFKLTHSIISRYEGGKLMPPPGYLFCLAQLVAERRPGSEQSAKGQQQNILREINNALHWSFAHDKPLRNWEEMTELAQIYREKQLGLPTIIINPDFNKSQKANNIPFEDWGEAPDIFNYYNREEELTELGQWILADRCRLVVLHGMGGIGKTALAVKLARDLKNNFEFIIWSSLHSSLGLDELLENWIRNLSRQQETTLPENLNARISLLISYLRKAHCLLILDNVESILQGNEPSGRFREGYEGYGRLLKRLGETNHQSCLILTSREKPVDLLPLEGNASPVRTIRLTGLGKYECEKILQDKGLQGGDETIRELEMGKLKMERIPPIRLKVLARYVNGVRAQALERLSPDRQIASLLAFAWVALATTQDDSLEVLEQLTTSLLARAETAGLKERLRTLPELDEAALQLKLACEVLLDAEVEATQVRPTVYLRVSASQLRLAIALVGQLTRPNKEDNYYELLLERYKVVRNFLPKLLTTIQF